MTAAYRLKGVGWLGGCVAVVLGFYLVSLQVAAERKKLDGVNAQIQGAERDIRALETEFDTRGNLAQLEKWNGDTLALAAPTAGQFVRDETALASIDVNQVNGVQTAALVVPSMPAGQVPYRPQGPAVATIAAPMPVAAAGIVRKAIVQTASVGSGVVQASVAMRPGIEATIRRAVAVAKVRPQAVAMLDTKLLSDTTLGDILSGARAEAGHRN